MENKQDNIDQGKGQTSVPHFTEKTHPHLFGSNTSYDTTRTARGGDTEDSTEDKPRSNGNNKGEQHRTFGRGAN
jgi:hypothetical protein